jgi:hypothetical protein
MATQGMGTLGVADITIDGKTVDERVSAAVADITINRTIVGASTLAVMLNDPKRTILRSGVFDHHVRLTLDGLVFTLVEVSKATDLLTLTFEDADVRALRQVHGHITAAAGTTTRSQFAERIVRQSPGVVIHAYPDPQKTREPLSRGTKKTSTENSWKCLTRLADEVQWRCFADGGAIWFGPDSWLMDRDSEGTFTEFSDGVDNIDFDYDEGKPLTSITMTCTSTPWGIPPGRPATLASMGITDGDYLVNTINRSLFRPTTTVTLAAPQKALPEPKGVLLTGSGTGSGSVATSAGAKSNQAIANVQCIPFGWSTGAQWTALLNLWTQESGWSNTAQNPKNGAYGIPQSLPYTKMPKAAQPSSAGGSSDASAQIAWGLAYIKGRYGSPVNAWAHEVAEGWY